jgi:hypothetical protein
MPVISHPAHPSRAARTSGFWLLASGFWLLAAKISEPARGAIDRRWEATTSPPSRLGELTEQVVSSS